MPGNLNISFEDRVMDGDGEGMDMSYSQTPKSASASSKKNSIFTPTQLFSHQPYTTTPTTTSSYSHSNSSPTTFDFTNAASNYSPNTTPPTNKDSKFSKRTTKVNGLFAKNGGSREDNRETRRKLFLKRVKQGSEDKRWNDRGGEEEIMRVLWLGEERRRLEGLRAAGVFGGAEEVDELFGEEGLYGEEEEEVDEVARLEELEVEARIEEMRREQERERAVQSGLGYQNQQPQQSWNSNLLFNQQEQQQEQEREQFLSRPTSMYGSDDDEYDDIFQDVIEEEIRMSQQQSQSQQLPLQSQNQTNNDGEDQDMMDLS